MAETVVDSGCDLYDGGRCRKFDARKTCAKCRSNKSWFTDKLQVCDVGEVCRRGSIFGNSFFVITEEQLEMLKQGKVLYDLDEYGTFIMLKENRLESEITHRKDSNESTRTVCRDSFNWQSV